MSEENKAAAYIIRPLKWVREYDYNYLDDPEGKWRSVGWRAHTPFAFDYEVVQQTEIDDEGRRTVSTNWGYSINERDTTSDCKTIAEGKACAEADWVERMQGALIKAKE